MATLLNTVAGLTGKQLNAITGAYLPSGVPIITQPIRDANQILEVCRSAVASFGDILTLTQNHPDLLAFATDSSPLASNTELTIGVLPKSGSIVGVRVSYTPGGAPAQSTYWVAQAVDPEEIRNVLRDMQAPPTGLGLTEPWYVYAVEAGRLYHPGNVAIIRYVGDLTGREMDVSAYKYVNGIVALAMAALLPFMGASDTAANHYLGLATAAQQQIMQGKPVPPVTPPKQG